MSLIPGLTYLADYIDSSEHDELVRTIDVSPWRADLARRTQHYGYVYDYKARRVDPSMYVGPLPAWLAGLAERVTRDGYCALVPDQAIINEYRPGQGIADHIDCQPCFGEVVLSLSLLSPIVMEFKRAGQSVPLVVAPGGLLVMQAEARYQWTHGIARRMSDIIDGRSVRRQRRLSITFRSVRLPDGR